MGVMKVGMLRRHPWLLLLSPTVLIAILIAAVVAVAVGGAMAGTGSRAGTDTTCGGQAPTTAGAPVEVAGVVGGLTPEQLQNFQTVAGVALAHGLGRQGVRIVAVVIWTEATAVNVNYGDMMGPGGSMSSSRGLYQQLTPWGPLEDRTDPVKATEMFINGGQGGQPGLLDIPNWWTLPIPHAAQEVQLSEFNGIIRPYAENYQGNLATTDAIVESLLAGQTVPDGPDPAAMAAAQAAPPPATDVAAGAQSPAQEAICSAPGAPGGLTTVIQNGVDVTIPDHPEVVEALRGKTIQAPNEGIAKGLAAGFAYLGYPYVWGGGGDGAGPNDGCTRGGGDLNSCQGLLGFDCSGLTAYVAVQGGFASPGGNSGAQRASNSVPWDQGLPGDIIGFPGHVAVYLGMVDGTPYIFEASTPGVPLHIVALTRSDMDNRMFRYYTATP